MDKWLGRLESSNWLANVRDTLNCACLVAQCLDKVLFVLHFLNVSGNFDFGITLLYSFAARITFL